MRGERGEVRVAIAVGGARRDDLIAGELRALRHVARDDVDAGRRDAFEHGALDVRGMAANVVEVEHRAVRAAEEHHAVRMQGGAEVFEVVGRDVGGVEVEIRFAREGGSARAQPGIRP